MSNLFDKFNDGGPLLTYPILILLIVIIGLIAYSLIKQSNNGKNIALISSLGWFTLAWSFLGRTFGLIMAFDNVQAAGELTPRLMAHGFKMALINPLFGIIVFLIARAGILLLISLKKPEEFDNKGSIKKD